MNFVFPFLILLLLVFDIENVMPKIQYIHIIYGNFPALELFRIFFFHPTEISNFIDEHSGNGNIHLKIVVRKDGETCCLWCCCCCCYFHRTRSVNKNALSRRITMLRFVTVISKSYPNILVRH